ncbi:MAG: methyltransferase domain-containing protein [Agathobacter sp.]
MKLPGYYSSGQFAKMAQVSLRTVRFYDKQNILKPSYVNESGARFYTDSDFARLQQILLFKYLGFSLDDIKGMLVDDLDLHYLKNSLKLQKQLVLDRIEQMELVASAIDDTVAALETAATNQEAAANTATDPADRTAAPALGINWSQMLDLIHLTGMEKSLKSQYQNASNISARIRLHKEYSVNKQGWFPWLFEQFSHIGNSSAPIRILELGCGNGALWTENMKKIPYDSNLHITLSDISEGMIRDVRRTIGSDPRFSFETFDCHTIPYPDSTFDLVIANHLLFYCDDIDAVCKEVCRVLKNPDGLFVCSTYGAAHMKEITDLVQGFDNRIVLSGEKLYERFGLENGGQILKKTFDQIVIKRYEDEIILNTSEPLIEYILSCHGNQNQYLLDRFHDFQSYVEKKTKKDFHITKDAGVFLCKK